MTDSTLNAVYPILSNYAALCYSRESGINIVFVMIHFSLL